MNLVLAWKAFQVNPNKVHLYFKQNLNSNYDGLICTSDCLELVFNNDYSPEDESTVNNYWNNLTEADFELSNTDVIISNISNAISFGHELMLKFSAETVLMGILQAGKAKQVGDYLTNLERYLRTGSLYVAIIELQTLIASPPPDALAPFITIDRLTSYKIQIETYLNG